MIKLSGGYTVCIILFSTVFCLKHLKSLNKSFYFGREDLTWMWLEYGYDCEDKQGSWTFPFLKTSLKNAGKYTHTHIHRATSKRILKNNCEDLYIVRVNSIKKNQQVNVSLKVVNMYLYYLYIY